VAFQDALPSNLVLRELANKARFSVICIHLEAFFAGLNVLEAESEQDWAVRDLQQERHPAVQQFFLPDGPAGETKNVPVGFDNVERHAKHLPDLDCSM
jgi:hypothetical protein